MSAAEPYTSAGGLTKQSSENALLVVDDFCRAHLPPNFSTSGPQKSPDLDGRAGTVCFGVHRVLDREFIINSIVGKKLRQKLGDYLDFYASALGRESNEMLWEIVLGRNNLVQDRVYKRGRIFSAKDFAEGGSANMEAVEKSPKKVPLHPQRLPVVSSAESAASVVGPQALRASDQASVHITRASKKT